MVRVTLWPQLLLVTLILRQSAAVSDQCSQLQEEISRLKRDIVSIRDLKSKAEIQANINEGHLRKQILILQATSKELNKSIAVNNDLKIQLEVKDEVLKSINEKYSQLHTTIDGLTKRVELLNETSQLQCVPRKDVCRSLLDAAKSGDVDSVKRLVKCDSNDKCSDDDINRNTPLTYSARYGYMEVVRVLLEGGANVERADDFGRTALHRAAMYGHLDLCRLLLDWGANVGPLNRNKDTPLHYAAWYGHLSVVELLVERGADVSVKGNGGKTAIEVARGRGDKSVADWLENVRRKKGVLTV